MKALLWSLALVTAGLMTGLLAALILSGAPALTASYLLDLEQGMLPALVSTGWLCTGALLIAVPPGVGAAIWLQEYAPAGALVRVVRLLTEALAGVPSILFGLFGFSLFVVGLGWGWSLLSGSATLALMLLPTIIRTAQEALAAVPEQLREGAAALGATRWEVVSLLLLRAALPGVAAGVVLALGRALGETAAVLLTAGSAPGMPLSPLDPGRSLAVHIFLLATEGAASGQAAAAGLVLLLGLLAVNLAANLALERWRSY